MKKNLLFGVMILVTNSLLAADLSPKDEVKTAAAALGNATNYTWRSTTEVPEDAQFKPGPTDGKTEKNGYTTLSFSFGDNTTQGVLKGTNGAVETEDGWKSISDVLKDNGGGGFNPTTWLARTVQNYKVPAFEAANLADAAKELKRDTNSIFGDLSESGAKAQLTFGSAAITNPKGSVKFWVKDGKLMKYQFHVTGSASFNGNDIDIDRTTTVEIKDVNATKISIPDEAKKVLP